MLKYLFPLIVASTQAIAQPCCNTPAGQADLSIPFPSQKEEEDYGKKALEAAKCFWIDPAGSGQVCIILPKPKDCDAALSAAWWKEHRSWCYPANPFPPAKPDGLQTEGK